MSGHELPDAEVAIAPASAPDLPDVLALLSEVALPPEGVEQHFGHFLVARDAGGRLVGCGGIERHSGIALLRSVAVAPGLQRSGLGTRLVDAVLEHARRDGAAEAVLLTTTAADFFRSRFGFSPAARADYDERLAASPEWSLPRCSSAAFLRREL